MKTKQELDINVLDAAKDRIEWTFDNFERIAVSFSGGKDSTVMLHLCADEAIKRGRKIAVMIVDLEAQYTATVEHMEAVCKRYKSVIDLHWVCLPISLSNAVSNFEPRWKPWDPSKKELWVRDYPNIPVVRDLIEYPFFQEGIEFEEFVVLWADWYAKGDPLAVMVGIRADESLNRFRTICTFEKDTFKGKRWTTGITPP